MAKHSRSSGEEGDAFANVFMRLFSREKLGLTRLKCRKGEKGGEREEKRERK